MRKSHAISNGLSAINTANLITLRGLQGTIVMLSVLLILGCSGGGDNDGPATPPLVGSGGNGTPAADASTDTIKENAVFAASRGVSINLDRLQQLNDGNPDIDGGNLPAEADDLDRDNNEILLTALGLGDLGALTQRDGDVITIDPDDNRLCEPDAPLIGLFINTPANCLQLASELTTEINAVSEDTGVITYLFQSMPLMRIGYSPLDANYEINLGAFSALGDYALQLDGREIDPTAQLSGVLRLSGRVALNGDIAEASDLRLEVTETLRIGANDAPSVTLEPSIVFALATDADTGEASVNVNWGALTLLTSSRDAMGRVFDNELSLGGLSAMLNVNNNDQTVSISNVGLGNVPLTVRTNSVEVVRVGFNTIGLSVDEATGGVTVNGDLGVSLVVDSTLTAVHDRFFCAVGYHIC